MNSRTVFSTSSSAIFPSLNPASITRRTSREVVIPTTLPRSRDVVDVVDSRSTTIMPDRPRSMATDIASLMLACWQITGSTHRRVCLALSTSDIGTLDNRCCLMTVALAWTGFTSCSLSVSLSLSSFSSSSLPVLSSTADEAGAAAVESLLWSRAADSSADNGEDDDDDEERVPPNREWRAPYDTDSGWEASDEDVLLEHVEP
mmetsp:Transcript_4931/g.13996  ORF Transcript_4931/g.13996 Transcript_4931/m.13996 type:complete len:203 (+) Transcript_4931:436-1044(+)